MTDLKQTLLNEMESYFDGDTKRVNHAKKVLSHAEKLLTSEPSADSDVVVAAAILHDIGICEAERKHNSNSGRFQEIEGPPVARKIMERINLTGGVIDEVCEIIAHHHTPGVVDTLNFRILSDADWLVNLADEYKIKDKERLRKTIEKVFLTDSGKKTAADIYLKK